VPNDDVDVSPAAADECGVIANLMQLYVHDFSQFWRGGPDGELQPDGRFPEYPLETYWQDAGWDPLLIRVGGHLAGFVLVNGVSHSGEELDRNVGEFFIVRKHRRGGVGTAAARAVFSRWPGRWEAAVARRNAGALAFWREAVNGHPDVSDVRERDVEDELWNGFILQFRIGAAGP
jgi:predicted acetyltransferase